MVGPIEAIVFDGDGVLVDSRQANIAKISALLENEGYKVPSQAQILACFHLPEMQTLKKLVPTDNHDELDRLWGLLQYPAARRVDLLKFPDHLEEELRKLARRYLLGVATGRTAVGMRDVFDARDIEKYFGAVVTYEDYEHVKPHPEPILKALGRLGVRPKNSIYVGDSTVDVMAAKAVNMPMIHLHGDSEKHPNADLGIQSFDEVYDAVTELTEARLAEPRLVY